VLPLATVELRVARTRFAPVSPRPEARTWRHGPRRSLLKYRHRLADVCPESTSAAPAVELPVAEQVRAADVVHLHVIHQAFAFSHHEELQLVVAVGAQAVVQYAGAFDS